GLLPTALMTLGFWWAGALPDYLDANLRANVTYLGEQPSVSLTLMRLRWGLLPLLGLLPWPFVQAWSWADPARRRPLSPFASPLGAWLALWLIAAVLDVALPLKLWKHYFNALIPPLSLIAGLAVARLTRGAGSWRPAVFAGLLAIVLLPAVGSIIK